MNAQQLRNSILQEAIQGRLVPQDPNDEPASVLLERIREEKKRLVKEGKLKKKDLEETPISEDEIPFEIPESWEWVRFGDVIDVRDGTHDTPAYINSGYPLITGKDFFNGYFELSKTQYISESDYFEICKRSKVDIGDILFSMIGGNIGSKILITEENYFEMAIKNVALFKQYPSYNINANYLSLYLEARIGHIKSIALGGAQSFVSLKQLRAYLFPLPPLAEQKRIVAKIEELLPKVEEYGKAQEELDKLNEELPERLKKSVLQEAISGKLVPQDPNDEPASVLLNRIREEKKRLVKAGKLKKKDLEETPISEDEIPFDIPDSWEWVRLKSLVILIGGTSYKKDDVTNAGVRILRGGNILNNKLYIFDDDVFIPYSFQDSEKNIRKGDIIIVASTGSQQVIGKPAFVMEDKSNCQIGAFLRIVRPLYIEIATYINIFFSSEYYRERIRNKVQGTNIYNIRSEYIENMLIPLPPLAEQKRIVAKIEEAFKAINALS